MANHPQRLTLQMDADERLAAAAGGAARYFADSAGMPNEQILSLQAAVIRACAHCFTCHTTAHSCDVTLQRFENRIEVELALPGVPSAEKQVKPNIPGVDEVHCEFAADSSRMRLVKFFAAAPSEN